MSNTYKHTIARAFHKFFNQNPFGDIFNELRNRNSDTQLAVMMTIEETFSGKELSISVQKGNLPKIRNLPPDRCAGDQRLGVFRDRDAGYQRTTSYPVRLYRVA